VSTATTFAEPVLFDVEQARIHLQALFDRVPDLIEVRAILDGTLPERSFHATIDSALVEIEKAAESKRNVYVGLATRRSNANGTRENLSSARALWADCDFKEEGDREAHEVALEGFPFPPSLRVFSGGGEHVYWILEEPFSLDTTESVKRFENTLKGIADVLRADRAVTDASRVLRVPGTTNFLDERKRATGRVPAPCVIHHLGDALYSFEDFEELELRGAALAGTARGESYNRNDWSGELPKSVSRLADGNESIRRLLTTAADSLEYPSDSEVDLAIATKLAHRDVPGAEIEASLRWRRAQVGARSKHDGYYVQTTEKALASASNVTNGVEPAAQPSEDEHLTDLGNAKRLVRLHGKDLLYCHPWGKWLNWDGKRFALDRTGEVRRRAKDTVARLYGEATDEADSSQRKTIATWARKSESQPRIEAMIALAASERAIPIMPEMLDADPWTLTADNGVIDLRTGSICPHERSDLSTKLVPIPYRPEARCVLWEKFLEEVIPDVNVRDFVQRAVGYSLTGVTWEQVFFLLWGSGLNGKTTFVETLLALFADYGLRTPTDTLLARRDSGIPNDVARLRGARFVSAVEVEEGRRLAEVRVKELTGGDTVSARFMRGEWFDFKPIAKLWLATNHKPVVRGTDVAIWRRIRLIPFTVTVEKPDPELPEKLRAELSGILAWAVRGCLNWQSEGFTAPDAVKIATEGYRAEQDTLGTFLEERCVLGENRSVPSAELYDDYKQWADTNRERALSQKALGSRLSERGFQPGRERKERTRVWRGLDLLGRASAGASPYAKGS
jgi:putative DNA primase/helicase